jgi:hypothetical protein
MAQREPIGQSVLAAHAAEGLQRLLGVCAAGPHAERADAGGLTADLKASRAALATALTNIEIMLRLLGAGRGSLRPVGAPRCRKGGKGSR